MALNPYVTIVKSFTLCIALIFIAVVLKLLTEIYHLEQNFGFKMLI